MTPETSTRTPMNPVVQQRLSRENAERIAAEREAEMLAAQLNRAPPIKPADPQNPTIVGRPNTFRRIPMNVARRKLEVRPIAGFRLYWHKQSDIEAALDAGYQFVDKAEVSINSHSIGAASGLGGNTALASEVSIVGSKGTGERLVLMKQPEAYYQEDKRAQFQEYATRMRAIFEGELIMMQGGEGRPDVVIGPDGQLHGNGTTYVKKQPYVALFNRGPRVAPQVAGAKVRTY